MSKENTTPFRDKEHFVDYLSENKPTEIYEYSRKGGYAVFTNLRYSVVEGRLSIKGKFNSFLINEFISRMQFYFKQGMYVKHKD